MCIRNCMMTISALFLFIAVANAREWTDSTGAYKVEAEFIELTGDTIKLRLQSGTIKSVPLEKLSRADQEFARQATAAPKKVALSEEVPKDFAGISTSQGDAARALPHPVNDIGTKILEKLRIRDIAEVTTEMRLASFVDKSLEERNTMVNDIRADIDRLAKLEGTTSLADADELRSVLARPEVATVILNVSQSGLDRMKDLEAATSEQPKTDKDQIKKRVQDTISGVEQDALLDIEWHRWSWISLAIYEGTMIVEIRLDAERWRANR